MWLVVGAFAATSACGSNEDDDDGGPALNTNGTTATSASGTPTSGSGATSGNGSGTTGNGNNNNGSSSTSGGELIFDDSACDDQDPVDGDSCSENNLVCSDDDGDACVCGGPLGPSGEWNCATFGNNGEGGQAGDNGSGGQGGAD
jgi:hypothetical protein